MNHTDASPPPTGAIAITMAEGWNLRETPTIGSTNASAALLPAWSAVRADVQTGGRGRHPGRRWVSDEGGLWLSAVLPCPGGRAKWAILPLAAGWAVINALREFGVAGPRLRWPNDIMVGRRKLCGLLVERHTPDTCVVGIGLNVFNHPEGADPALAGQTIRLADLAPGTYTLPDLTRTLLGALRAMHAQLLDSGFGGIAAELNQSWVQPRRVEVSLVGPVPLLTGYFHGIDPEGRLRLAVDDAAPRTYAATQVSLLRELE